MIGLSKSYIESISTTEALTGSVCFPFSKRLMRVLLFNCNKVVIEFSFGLSILRLTAFSAVIGSTAPDIDNFVVLNKESCTCTIYSFEYCVI